MIQETNGRSRQHSFARATKTFLFWIPVMIPLVLLVQLGTQGLQPALRKVHDLKEDERLLDEQLSKNERRHQKLKAELDAQADLIYRHRYKNRPR